MKKVIYPLRSLIHSGNVLLIGPIKENDNWQKKAIELIQKKFKELEIKDELRIVTYPYDYSDDPDFSHLVAAKKTYDMKNSDEELHYSHFCLDRYLGAVIFWLDKDMLMTSEEIASINFKLGVIVGGMGYERPPQFFSVGLENGIPRWLCVDDSKLIKNIHTTLEETINAAITQFSKREEINLEYKISLS